MRIGGCLYLGVDVGSKRLKMVVLSEDFIVVESKWTDVSDLLIRREEGWAERDATVLWDRMVDMFKGLNHVADVKAVCVDGTSGSIVPVDHDLNPLHPIMLYSDQRASREAEFLRDKSQVARDYEAFLPIAPYLTIPKVLWLKRNFRDFRRIYKILHESDYFVAKLSGSIATSPNTAGKSHVDVRSWDYLEEAYRDVGLDLDIMPPVKPIGEVVGYVSREASKLTGLPEGIPVVNSVTDSSAGDIATGCLSPGHVNVNLGTTLVVHAVVSKPEPDVEGRIYYKCYVNNSYLTGGATNAGTIPLDTVSKAFKLSHDELESLASQAPPGCDGLRGQPEWVGTRVPRPNPSVRGFLVGISEENFRPGWIYRSFLEGNAAILLVILEIIEEVTRTKPTVLKICGGGSKCKLQNQIIADSTGLRVERILEGEPALGSAMLAASASTKTSLEKIASKAVKRSDSYEPDPRHKEVYSRIKDEIQRITWKIYEG